MSLLLIVIIDCNLVLLPVVEGVGDDVDRGAGGDKQHQQPDNSIQVTGP